MEMSLKRKNWTREETIAALALYHQIEFRVITSKNKEIIKLAELLGRTPAALAMKMCNLARFDETLRSRNISGLANGSKMDRAVWNEFLGKTAKLAVENARILSGLNASVNAFTVGDSLTDTYTSDIPLGLNRETITRARIGQSFFRNAILANYEEKCCMTGISVPKLLIASHIIPWADANSEERTNPSNGLCLNALHDKAFDQGLITVTPDYVIHVSSLLRNSTNIDEAAKALILDKEGEKIILPHKFQPKKEFLEYHNDVIFQSG